ncbi:MAG: ABC transporter ATP-binding protein [Nitrospirae bacterium]|nr:ABC transporter ATP-binding protein [Nitrospirota bacterium]
MNAIEVNNLTKIYRLYKSHKDRVKEIISLNTKKYHHDFHALNDVSFTINQGETVGIIGQNGSGKSTLLKIICGVTKPTSGNLKVNGRISSLLELGAGFHPDFTGRENVYMNGALMGFSKEEMEMRLPEIEAFAEIGEFIEQPVKHYSSGMYVRLAFAAAINVNPDILIVDEALAVGDAGFQFKCFFKLQELQSKQKTILFVSHDMNTIKKYCSKVVLLDKGQINFNGNPNEAVNIYSKILFNSDKKSYSQNDIINEGAQLSYSSTENKEFRYGSREGEITDIMLFNSKDESVNVFTSGEKMTVRFQVFAKQDISNPVVAMTFKDIKGQEIYSTNSHFKGVDLPSLREGSEVEVSFSQVLNLIPNTYFISLGFVRMENGKIIPMDRRYDVIEIKVVSKDNDFSIGIANLDSQIEVKRIKKCVD